MVMNKSSALACLVPALALFIGSPSAMRAQATLIAESSHHQFAPIAMAGTWTWDASEKIYPGTIDFENDGTGSHGARNNTKWKKTGEREITIAHATRGIAIIHIEADSQSFVGTDYYGKRVSGRKTHWGKT